MKSIPIDGAGRVLEQKLAALAALLKRMEPFIVAFSGGVDSTFLLAAAKQAAPGRVLAVTVSSAFVPRSEIQLAEKTAAILKVKHMVIKADVFAVPLLAGNPPDRCFHCKKAVFSKILDAGRAKGFDTLLHAVNLDDLGDYRPGLEAARELGVFSPLVEAGFTKTDIREASRLMGLETWDKPSQSCLATRIPYNVTITDTELRRIERAEAFLHDLGFDQVRVRVQDTAARIEVLPDLIGRLTAAENRGKITQKLKALGFRVVSVDMEGYATGKMNDEILSG